MPKGGLSSIAAIAVAAMLGVSVLGFGAYAYVNQPPKVLRDEHGCAVNEPLASTTVVLVDATDLLSPAHLTQLDASVQGVRRATPVNGKVLIALLDPAKPDAVTVVLEVCNPGAKGGAASAEPSSSASVDQAWRQKYLLPFDVALEAARNGPLSKDKSPIAEAIGHLTQRADFDTRVKKRHLIVISDGLQLTPGVFNVFEAGKDLWAAYQRSGLPALAQANLREVDVEFVYLLREKDKSHNYARYQTKAHREFWRRWFLEHGAKAVTYIGGGTS